MGNKALTAQVQREDKSPKPTGTVSTPFDASKATDTDLAKVAVPGLKTLVSSSISSAYASYLSAIQTVQRELGDKVKEEEKRGDAFMMAITMLAGMAAPAIAGVVEAVVADTARNVIIGAALTTEKVTPEMAGKAFDFVKSKASAEKATEWVKKGVESLDESHKKSLEGTTPSSKTISYLEALGNSADQGQAKLLESVAGMTDAEQLLGLYQGFRGAHREVYLAQVRDIAQGFASQVATAAGGKAKAGIYKVNAWGRERLVNASYDPGNGIFSGGHYRFNAWVTPNMEAAALAFQPNPQVISSDSFDRLPDPVATSGTGTEGSYRLKTVMVDKYPGRLATVRAEMDGKVHDGKQYGLVSWVPKDEEAVARLHAEQQIGGIPTVAADLVVNLTDPGSA